MKQVERVLGVRGRGTASRLRRFVAVVALTTAALIAVAAQAQAATFTVGTTADSGGCASPPSGTTCTLRQLVDSVPAGSTISVPAGIYMLTSGPLVIEQNLTIAGAGARTTTVEQNPPVGSPTARVYEIRPDPASGVKPTVTISGMTIEFGKADSTNGSSGGNVLNQGTLTLKEDDIVLGQSTGGAGAAIENQNGTLTVTHSLLEDNLSFASDSVGGTAGAIDSVASGLTTASVTVDNSTIVSNTAQGGGGALVSRCVRCTTSTIAVTSSTIAFNDGGTATTNAGGLVAATGSTISVLNSIVASNTVSSGKVASNCLGTITSQGHNIETAADCGFTGTGDLQNTDPQFLFTGVRDMGGNTDVLPLSAGSPAVDAIPSSATNCARTTDQRDIARPQGANCDIGAYELIEPVEGASFSEVVGRIDNTSATIDWGDGTAQSAGSVNTAKDNQVTGTHTYAEAGTYHGTLHWINSDGRPSTSAFDVIVTDAPLSATATPFTAVAGTAFSGQVASFTDGNPLAKASDFTATITWGDGAKSAGTIATNPAGGFLVNGTHTYASTGSFGTTIAIKDVGGSTASDTGTATVLPPAPTVTAVGPTAGPTAGGTSVTITGTNLTGATAVKFGTTAATTFTVNSATKITATAPAGSAGTVDVTVTTAGGTSAASANDHYTYVARPSVTSVSPSSGPTAGGTSVTITGTNLTGATAVKFGATAATTFTVNSATKITATAPAGTAGTVDATVTTVGGSSATSASDQYTYASAPTVTSLSPAAGPTAGGTSVTITGTNLTGATAVKFGATAATTFTVNSATKITATAPAGSAGTVDVVVTTPGGVSPTVAGDHYTYATGPVVTSIMPTGGPIAGGTTVTINGANFTGATPVKFGATNATAFTVNNSNKITATAPAHSAGTVDITVTSPGGTSPTGANDQYTFAAAPSVTSITPAFGPSLGGTPVTIVGTNLSQASVQFGGTPAHVVTNTPVLITVESPAGSSTVPVKVTTPGGSDSSRSFTFVPPPTVTGISPSSGPASGATSVTITGTNFSGATAVTFGATPAASFSVVGPTKITATSPAGSGVADVKVTTPNGTSSINPADRFTYNPTKIPPPPGSPMVATGAPTVKSSSGAALEGSVNPQGLSTTAHYEYGLDSKFRASGPVYDQSTPSQNVGSDFTSHTVTATLSGLVPNALYHVRLVANNSAGTTFGPDATFTTKADPPPAPPKLGGSFNAEPVNGVVFVKINGKFVPITEVRQIPNGAIINALHGTLVLTTAAGGNGPGKVSQAARAKSKKPKVKKVTTQSGTFGGAVFKVTQVHSGLVTLSLVEGASFQGAPTYASCKTHAGKATVAALSKRTLQLLRGRDKHGKFRTKGRYAAATVRGTVWSTADRCDGTLTHVTRGTVVVSDFVRHKTITVHAGHSYLALARPLRHK